MDREPYFNTFLCDKSTAIVFGHAVPIFFQKVGINNKKKHLDLTSWQWLLFVFISMPLCPDPIFEPSCFILESFLSSSDQVDVELEVSENSAVYLYDNGDGFLGFVHGVLEEDIEECIDIIHHWRTSRCWHVVHIPPPLSNAELDA